MVKFGEMINNHIANNPYVKGINNNQTASKTINVKNDFSNVDTVIFLNTSASNVNSNSTDLINNARETYGNEYAAVNTSFNSTKTSSATTAAPSSSGITISTNYCDTVPPIQIPNEVSAENAVNLADIASDIEESLRTNIKKQDELNGTLEPMEAQVAKAVENLETSKEDLTDISEEVKTAAETAKNATAEYNKLQAKTAGYENKLNSKKLEHEKAEQAVSNAETEVTSAETGVSSAEGEVASAESSLSTLEASLSSASDEEKSKIESQISDAKKRVDTAKKNLDKANERLEKANQKLEKAKENETKAKEAADEAQKAYDGAKEQSDAAKEKMDEAVENSNNLKQEETNIKKEIQVLEEELKEQSEELNKAKAEIDKLQTEYDVLAQQKLEVACKFNEIVDKLAEEHGKDRLDVMTSLGRGCGVLQGHIEKQPDGTYKPRYLEIPSENGGSVGIVNKHSKISNKEDEEDA